VPSVIAYSFVLNRPPIPPVASVACAIDRARILKVEMEPRFGVNADRPEIVEAED
jgi:hypothetical protein